MTVIDPGHHYALSLLDYGENAHTAIRFVKRSGQKYPGNGHDIYPGTTLQEVLRACLDRVKYLDRQKRHWTNWIVRGCLALTICCLELRAALRHGRMIPMRPITGKQCWQCLHVGCSGECRKIP